MRRERGYARPLRRTRPSTAAVGSRWHEQPTRSFESSAPYDHPRLATLGGVRASSPRALARARRIPPRSRRRDCTAQRARPLHTSWRGCVHLGRQGVRHRGVDARRARCLLRSGGGQDLPAPDLLRRPRGGASPVSTPVSSKTSLFDYTLALADDALVSAQRMGWWISRAPELEEDVALANIGLDQLGQARHLLTYPGDLAYLRDDRDFRNVQLVERPMADFGVAMARLLVFATYQLHLYRGLAVSDDGPLAAVAAKAVKEVTYHVDHASRWVLRLGDGTDESHTRMQAALDAEWPFVDELFTPCHP